MKIQLSDALQAVVTAILFGADAGLSAGGDSRTLRVGGGRVAHLTGEARRLLAEAQEVAVAVVPDDHGAYHDYHIDSEVAEHLWMTRRET